MPRELNPKANAPLSLEECVERLDSDGFDPIDEASLQNAAHLLAGLAANRSFLGDIIIDELAIYNQALTPTEIRQRFITLY